MNWQMYVDLIIDKIHRIVTEIGHTAVEILQFWTWFS